MHSHIQAGSGRARNPTASLDSPVSISVGSEASVIVSQSAGFYIWCLHGVIGPDLWSTRGYRVSPAFTASLSAFPALNEGDFDADIEVASPVRGLRPVRVGRVLAPNVPNPSIRTSAPFARASPIVANTLSTASLAAALFIYSPDPAMPPFYPRPAHRPFLEGTITNSLPLSMPSRPNSVIPSWSPTVTALARLAYRNGLAGPRVASVAGRPASGAEGRESREPYLLAIGKGLADGAWHPPHRFAATLAAHPRARRT